MEPDILQDDSIKILDEYLDSSGDYIYLVEVDAELNRVLTEKYGIADYGPILSDELNSFLEEKLNESKCKEEPNS